MKLFLIISILVQILFSQVELKQSPSSFWISLSNKEKISFINGTYSALSVLKKKHKDDLAYLEMLISCDDCEPIKKIGIWEIELTPDNNIIEENNYPDWYGYQKIDEK